MTLNHQMDGRDVLTPPGGGTCDIFFRITGYYDLEGIDENGNPKFTKLAHNVKLTYNKDAESWVINNDGTNMAFAVSNAASPAHIDANKWNIRLEKDGYDRFVSTSKAAGE